jgi:RecA-superfamily ATPases implicated in signal transduction
MSEERKPILESISTLKEAGKEAPKLEGVPTGVEGLDDMFFTTRIIDGKPKKTPLGGIPKYAVINITGVSDTGKSLFVEQFAVKRASENDVLIFVTVEHLRPFWLCH